MKEKWKYKKLFYLILIIIVFSLGITAIIVTGMIDDAEEGANTESGKYWFFEEAEQTGRTVLLENAYVYSNDDGQLEFVYDYVKYVIEGHLSQAYEGIADIYIDGDQITKIFVKTDVTEGVLHSYEESTVSVLCKELDIQAGVDGTIVDETAHTEVLSQSEAVTIYRLEQNGIVQGDWNDVIVGTSKIQCVLEEGKIVAIVIEESLPSDIRVVIKNGSTIFYPNLYIKKVSEDSITNVKTALLEQKVEEIEITDTQGLQLCDENGNKLGEVYEGIFRILQTENGLVLINELPIETYVKYVLPSEMPKSFHEEALKAQAVCARTFAYDQMRNQSYAMYGANLDDSTAFQVYHATGRYTETDAAVDATKGEIITCNGDLITCYYFSTSAGMTNDMSVWGSTTPEYITQRESLDTDSPFYRWKAYLDISIIQESEYGAMKSLEVLSKNSAGYVTELRLTYANNIITISNENDIRKVLGKYLQETVLLNGKVRTDLSMIPSSNFKVLEELDGRIILEGGGFGHGIGMSQYGANQMANSGFGYKAIIEHYYNHVVVKNI